MAKIDAAYTYYLTTYGKSTVSRYDSHKKSELRKTYNQIVKLNKESPLYKISSSGDVKKFAIDIKENARNIKNIVASLSEDDDGLESNFQKKIAVSNQEDVVSAEYVGQGASDNTNSFQMEITHLATPQINHGNFLASDTLDIPVGSYSFDLNTPTNSYEFQFNVNSDDTNRSVQEKLKKLVNTANIGLSANITTDEDSQSALILQSTQTGLSDEESSLFSIYPNTEGPSMTAMNVLGIDQMTSPATNAAFLLNGNEHIAYSNTFTINNTFEVTLKGISEPDSPATVGFKANADAIADNVEELISSYNAMIHTAETYSSTQPESHKLLYGISNVAKRYYNEFESMGLSINDDSYISIDRDLLTDAVTGDDSSQYFTALNQFKDDLKEKASEASLNPMSYVNKLIVAYKNPGHNFVTPYITSIYSGMMLDRYC